MLEIVIAKGIILLSRAGPDGRRPARVVAKAYGHPARQIARPLAGTASFQQGQILAPEVGLRYRRDACMIRPAERQFRGTSNISGRYAVNRCAKRPGFRVSMESDERLLAEPLTIVSPFPY